MKIFLFLSLLFLCHILYSQCPNGDVVLTTQEEVDLFSNKFPECKNINGNLIIKTNNIANITSLENLEDIQGDFIIENTLISGDLNFDFILHIGGSIDIKNNNNLERISFNNLNSFFGNLIFDSNIKLKSIRGFDLTSCFKSIRIKSNSNLENIPLFNSVINAFNLDISNNLLLKSIGEFKNIREIKEELHIQNNGGRNQVNIPTFNNLLEVKSIVLTKQVITNINGFKNLINVENYIRISDLEITKIIGFNKLQRVRDLFIINNDNLKEISAFHSLREISLTFELSNNNLLDNVDGFPNLRNIGQSLLINSNNNLQNLTFLSALISFGNNTNSTSFIIEENSLLNDCNSISNFFTYGRISTTFRLSNNGFNCNSVDFIKNNGDNDNDGILDAVDLDDDNDGILDTVEQKGDPNLDSDGDLIPDHLDLDSNNNGCWDVIEAGFTDSDSNGTLGSLPDTVDFNGKIIEETTAYITPLDDDNNGKIDFQDISLSPIITQQPEHQSVNIGSSAIFFAKITNTDTFQWELSTDNGQTWISLTNGSNYNGTNRRTLIINNAPIHFNNYIYRLSYYNSQSKCNTALYTNQAILKVISNTPNAGEDNSIKLCSNSAQVDLFTILKGTPDINGQWIPKLKSGSGLFDPKVDLEGTYTYQIINGDCLQASAKIKVEIEKEPNSGLNSTIKVCSTANSIDLHTMLAGQPDTGGTWSPNLASGSGVFDVSKDLPGNYTYTVSNGCGTNTSTVTVIIDNNKPIAGENGSLEICINSTPVDLFDSLNGTKERGGVWTPSLSSGRGIFNPSIDGSGKYTYTINKGNCGSDTSEVDVVVTKKPKAGKNGSLDICINSTSVDLFDSLKGEKERGGVWTPSLSSGTGIFDPSIDISGKYTYTLNKGVCNTDKAEVNVTVSKLPKAGEDGNLDICISSDPVDLYDSLNGDKDKGGVWTPSLSSGTGIFNPSVDSGGKYIYTINNGSCGIDVSEVNVTVFKEPKAGENGSLEICINSTPYDLFDSLKGEKEKGGVWSPNLSSGTGMFNPLIDKSGIYTYIVLNSCGLSTSEVDVKITDVNPITDYSIKITEFNKNNSINIIINSNLKYNFSLDDINYQSSNTFNNLIGGDYTLHVKEIDGCGILKENIRILDYPKFFTPNNDGVNDTWKLLGDANKNYSISIYDRYGTLLHTMNSSKIGWNGTYNNKNLLSGDYWFKVVFDDGIIKKGHFTLKR